MSYQDTTLDILTLGGAVIPLGGEGEAVRVSFPPLTTVTAARSGGIKGREINRTGTITVSCYPSEDTHRRIAAIAAAQGLPGGLAAPLGGSLYIAGTGETVTWSDCAITQSADVASTVAPEVVTWIITTTDYQRIVPPVPPAV